MPYGRIYICLFFLLFVCCRITGQTILNRNEKISITPEKTSLRPGDTLVVSGIVVDQQNLQPSPYSKYVYLELFDETDSVLVRQKLFCGENGLFRTRIPIDVMSHFGVYYIRAYTQLMRNLPEWTFPTLPIKIENGIGSFPQSYPFLKTSIGDSVRFYPEGGNLIADCLQQTVFEVKDMDGKPVQTTGELLNEQDSVISSEIKSLENGLGSVCFIAKESQTYRLRLRRVDGSGCGIFPLPIVETVKPSIQLNYRSDKLYYSLLASSANKKNYRMVLFFRGIYLYDTMLGPNVSSGVLDISPYPSGIYTCLLLSDRDEKLAERLIFVQGHEYENRPILVSDKDVYKSGEDIQLSVLQKDTLLCTGIQFLDSRDTFPDFLQSDIVSCLLFTSDLPYPVPYMSRYLISGDRATRQQLDWLMVALRWSRFDLLESQSTLRFEPEQVLSFKGCIETELGFKQKSGSVIALHTETGHTYSTDITPEGHYRMGVDDFLEGSSFFIQAYNKKGKCYNLKVLPAGDTFPGIDNRLKYYYRKRKPVLTETTVEVFDSLSYYYDDQNQKNYRLPEIQVQARLKEKLPETKYFFSPSKITEETIDEFVYPNLLPYLQRMIGITVDYISPSGYVIRSSRGASLLATDRNSSANEIKPNEVPILLDGALVDSNWAIETLDPKMITSIERLSPVQALAHTPFCFNGIILIKTRNYVHSKVGSKGIQYLPLGLSAFTLPPSRLPGTFLAPSVSGDYMIRVECISKNGVPYSLTKMIRVAE